MSKPHYARTLVVLLLVLISSTLLSQTVMSRESLGLKGAVKVHTITGSEGDKQHYYFDRDGNLTRYWFEGYPYYNNAQAPLEFIYERDNQDRIIRINKGDNRSNVHPHIEFNYHPEGWVQSVIEHQLGYDPYEAGRYTRTLFESAGKKALVEVCSEDGSVLSQESFSYDANGLLVSYSSLISDEGYHSSVTTSYFYDSSGRKQRSESDSSEAIFVTSYHYNQKGLLIRERMTEQDTQSEVSIKSYEYDDLDRLIEVVMSYEGDERISLSYTYDEIGNVLSEYNDPSGRIHRYEYYP